MASWDRTPTGFLRVQFYLKGTRYREPVGKLVKDTKRERHDRRLWLAGLTLALRSPQSFDYATWFPESKERRDSPKTTGTLGAHARRWLASRKRLTPKARRDYEYLFRVFLDRTALGAMPPRDVTRIEIEAALEGKSAYRAKKFLALLKRIYHILRADGVCEKDPSEFVDNPHREENKEPVEPLTESEQAAIIAACENARDRNLILVGLWTGLRPGEICRIERRDVDVERRRLVVRGTKTKASARVCDLDPRALAALRGQIISDAQLGPLFFGEKLGRRLSFGNWRRRVWKPLLEKAGVPYRKPGNLRHCYPISMLIAGKDPVWIAKQMGHKDSQTLHRYYARWTVPTEAVGK